MGNELTLTDQVTLAKTMADSTMLPRHMQRNPANLLWAAQYAQSLGVHPMTAITGIHVIDGRPTASADLIAALIRRAGHKLRVWGDDTSATAQIIRADDPTFEGFKVTWNIERAKAAGLLGKAVWKQYPAAMLRARAITEVARMAASECLHGVIYTPEELGANVTEDGEVVDQPTVTVTTVRDWLAEGAACATVDDLRRLWKEAEKAGQLATVKAEFTAIAERLKNPPPPADDKPFFDDEPAPAAEVG